MNNIGLTNAMQIGFLDKYKTDNPIINCIITFLFGSLISLIIKTDIFYYIKYLLNYYNNYSIKSKITVSCTINNGRITDYTDMYIAVSDWFFINQLNNNFNNLTSTKILDKSITNKFTFTETNNNNDNIVYILDQRKSIKYKKKNICLKHYTSVINTENYNDNMEKVKKTADMYHWEIYSSSLQPNELIEYCKDNILLPYKKKINDKMKKKDEIFIFDKYDLIDGHGYCDYEVCEFKSNKTINNLYYEEINDLIKLLDKFENNKKWYDEREIQHKLCLLFHGKPGCGKTSTIKAIKNYSNRTIIKIPLSKLTSQKALHRIFYSSNIDHRKIPQNKKLFVIDEAEYQGNNNWLLEDNSQKKDIKNDLIDEIENKNESISNKRLEMKLKKIIHNDNDEITTATFLELLDGLIELNGAMIIIVTNNINKLNKALSREGRIDKVIEFKFARSQDVISILEQYYKKIQIKELFTDEEYKSLNYKYSPAKIQNMCITLTFEEVIKFLKNVKHSLT